MRSIIKQIIITLGIIISFLSPNTAHSVTKTELLQLIAQAEKEYTIPTGLLLAVAKTESNLEAYALNISGRPHFFKDKNIASQTIRHALDEGITNIDIGAAQINYKWHGHKFSSIEDMLSPEVNIKYAAKLLSTLKQEHGDWHRAIRLYHSSKPKHHRQYSRKVVLCWLGV
jgi:soluble lytic murein transglycosylase-like protein